MHQHYDCKWTSKSLCDNENKNMCSQAMFGTDMKWWAATATINKLTITWVIIQINKLQFNTVSDIE